MSRAADGGGVMENNIISPVELLFLSFFLEIFQMVCKSKVITLTREENLQAFFNIVLEN